MQFDLVAQGFGGFVEILGVSHIPEASIEDIIVLQE